MKVLITGGAGYIGSVLTGVLLDRGLTVTVLDNFRYGGEGALAYTYHPRFELVRGDVGDANSVAEAMRDADTVIHLAALVGDRACDADTTAAYRANVDGTANVIAEAKKAGVERLLFASTASCYGKTDKRATEESSLQPLTQYALTKVAAEVLVQEANASGFQAVVLRFATVFGLSPRMRFDLIVNQFVYEAIVQNSLTIYSPDAWRSHIHVHDLARALWTLAVTRVDIGGQTFNVGGYNRRKRDILPNIEKLTGIKSEFVDKGPDNRDYRVSFDKLKHADLLSVYPQFRPAIAPEQGIYEIAEALQQGRFWSPMSDRHVNL